jgi:hypothetical protein
MVTIVLDPGGRLRQLVAVPPQRLEPGVAAAEPDWRLLFDRAGLDLASFNETTSVWTPGMDCDVRRAWEGTYPGQPDLPIQVEAGAYRGKPVWFEIFPPWAKTDRMGPQPETPGFDSTVILITVLLVIIAAALALARRNLRLGRGDRRGAFRTAAAVFAVTFVADLLFVHHVRHIAEIGFVALQVADALLIAFAVWSLYIALEPFVRRLWPEALISWNRLLSGRLRDPRIGRDILIGGAAYALAGLSGRLFTFAEQHFAEAPTEPLTMGFLYRLTDWEGGLSLLGSRLLGGFWFSICILFLLFLFRVVLRKQWAAVGAFVLLWTILSALDADAIAFDIPRAALWAGIMVFVVLRTGFLALVAFFALSQCAMVSRLIMDHPAWYAEPAIPFLAVFLGIALYGLHIALAGRRLFPDDQINT